MYNIKYYAVFKNEKGHYYRIDVYQRDYLGPFMVMGDLCGCVLEVQGNMGDIISPIVKTQLRFSLVDSSDKTATQTTKYGDWQEFFTPDDTLYKVQLSCGYREYDMSPEWTGYITPDSWKEDLDYRGIITITARDNIGHLKDFQFDDNPSLATPNEHGLTKIRELFLGALLLVDFPMPTEIEGQNSSQYGPAVPTMEGGLSLVEDGWVNTSIFEGMNWYEVLEQTLEAVGYTFRFVGNNKCEIACLRNLPKLGNNTEDTHNQVLEFYGGTLELDPAVKQIDDSLDYKIQEEVTFKAVGDMTYQSAPAYACVVDGLGGLPAIQNSGILDKVTDHGDTGWTNGSEMLDVSGLDADDQLINSDGSDGWKQYALIPGNRSVDDPSTSFSFTTKTSAACVTINFASFPYAIVGGSGADAGKVTEVQYALYRIKYEVMYQSEDGNTTRYWNGSGWASDHAHVMTQDYDAENTYGDALEITLSECSAIESGKITITFANIIYKRWDDEGNGVYARVKSIHARLISSRQLSSDKVTTINDPAYNVMLTRKPLFGPLSRKMGFIQPANYQAGMFYYSSSNPGTPPSLFPYMVKFSDQQNTALVPLPVLIHEQILCYYYGAARVLSGSAGLRFKSLFKFNHICTYRDHNYIFQGGTLDCFTEIIANAYFREYKYYHNLWDVTPPT